MRPERYFHIRWDYASWLHGMRWTKQADAITDDEGQTFVMGAQVALFLEGFVASGRLIHFACILHVMKLLGLTRHGDEPQPKLLWDLFHQQKGNVRNAGAFAAVLCEGAPAVADPAILGRILPLRSSSGALMAWLNSATDFGLMQDVPEALPFSAAEFEQRVKQALERYTLKEIAHWFQHGRGPIHDAGEQLGEELEATKPRTLAGVLAALTQRQRLAGAMPFVAQLVSALTLPPRRLARNELPLGGYADVTTRGQPEHLLPSQFALDDLEFVRRFAGGELLYFRREEPHAPLREELVVLLDQGARTWGDVRLVLGAAVFALGQRCVKRKLPLQVAATSNDGRLLDPLAADAEAVGQLLEASDLSLHPTLALETVLRAPTTAARDIVLLTHPRNLAEPDVAAAARCLQAGSRLFALTVDDAGRAALAELRHGVPVGVAQFRIDWALKARDRAPLPPVVGAAPEGWRGDVEPIPFPFRFGLTTRPTHFAFDQAGAILLIASGNGVLHAHRADGSLTEVLPRGMYLGTVLTEVESVLGAPNGFAVCGRLNTTKVVFHYHWETRTCKAHLLYESGSPTACEWFYLSEFHSVVEKSESQAVGVDLATGAFVYRSKETTAKADSREKQACQAVWGLLLPVPYVYLANDNYSTQAEAKPGADFLKGIVLMDSDDWLAPDAEVGEAYTAYWQLRTLVEKRPIFRPMIHIDSATGAVTFGSIGSGWKRWIPLADGLPLLAGIRLWSAQTSGMLLALLTSPLSKPADTSLYMFRLLDGALLRGWQVRVGHGWHHLLAPDGRKLARQTAETQFVVEDALHGGTPLSVTPVGGCHNNLTIELGEYWLALRIGGWLHLLTWHRESLGVGQVGASDPAFLRAFLQQYGLNDNPEVSSHAGREEAGIFYDQKRFRACVTNRLIAVSDAYSQVALFSQRQELLCMFFVFRDKLAAWMPDGTRYGPASVTGWSETPDALARIGKVLRDATERRSP